MNNLFAALFFFIIGASLGDKQVVKEINEIREGWAKENKITLKPLENSAKLNEMAKKLCDECPKKGNFKPIAGYKVYPIYPGEDNMHELEKGVFRYPETTEFGYCETKKCDFFSLYIVNSTNQIAFSLTFLMTFVMIFRGI